MTIREDARPTLDSGERKVLAALGDALIPSGGGMPSASQADVAGEWVDHVLSVRPDMAEDLVSLLNEVGDQEPGEAVERLRSQEDMWFDTLCEVVAGAYFLNPKIRDQVGYPGQQTLPIETSTEHLKQLTAPVVERGPIYRSCS